MSLPRAFQSKTAPSSKAESTSAKLGRSLTAKTSRLFRFRPKPQPPALKISSLATQQAPSSGDACCYFDLFHAPPPSIIVNRKSPLGRLRVLWGHSQLQWRPQ